MAYRRRALQSVRFRISTTGVLLAAAAIVGPALALDADAGSNALEPGRVNPEASTAQAAAQVGSEAPDVSLESIDGESLRLSDLRGDKNVILVFFRGTW